MFQYVDKVEKADTINLQVVEDHLHLDIDDDADIINEAEDTPTILESYVEALEIKTDKQKVKNLLRNLYDRALSIT